LLYKEVPDDGSCEPKHAALCDMCCFGLHIFVCLWCSNTQPDASE